MPCLWCTAMRRRTARNWPLFDEHRDMQAGSRAGGILRTHQHMEQISAEYRDGNNNTQAVPLSLKKHLSIEKRPQLVLDPSHICPMQLYLTFGISVWLLHMGREAVYFCHGLARAEAFVTALPHKLVQSQGVNPTPYFGGSFDGRQWQRVGLLLNLVSQLLVEYVPPAAGAAYAASCPTWREVLAVRIRVGSSSTADMTSFRASTAPFVDWLLGELI